MYTMYTMYTMYGGQPIYAELAIPTPNISK